MGIGIYRVLLAVNVEVEKARLPPCLCWVEDFAVCLLVYEYKTAVYLVVT